MTHSYVIGSRCALGILALAVTVSSCKDRGDAGNVPEALGEAVAASTVGELNSCPSGFPTFRPLCHTLGTVPADATCTATVSVFDEVCDPGLPAGAPIQCGVSVPTSGASGVSATLGLGADQPVDVTCTDADGSVTCHEHVTVVDDTAPEITCPENQRVACSSDVSPEAPTATDNCGAPMVTCSPDPSTFQFPDGTTTVVCTATDASGNESSCSYQVDVEPSAPVVTTTLITLWPPNHKYHRFTLSDCATLTDACGTTQDIDQVGKITYITSNEVEDAPGVGDGHTCNDILIPRSSTFEVRAERQGTSDGRLYTVYFTVTVPSHDPIDSSCMVWVPHDQSAASVAAVDTDDGCAYCVDATGSNNCEAIGCATHDPNCNY